MEEREALIEVHVSQLLELWKHLGRLALSRVSPCSCDLVSPDPPPGGHVSESRPVVEVCQEFFLNLVNVLHT